MQSAKREHYHHGDLRNALIQAGVGLAISGGPQAIVLGHAAKQVGVSSAAAYRHFPNGHDDLVGAIATVAHVQMADAMRAALADVRNSRDAAVLAMRRFRAVGRAYVEWALQDPGLFATSCTTVEPTNAAMDEVRDEHAFAILTSCLDDLEEAGLLAKKDRAFADVSAWSAVHGLAVLLTTGPLAALEPAAREAAIERVLDTVAYGLVTRV